MINLWPFHKWISVYVPIEEIPVSDPDTLKYSQQCRKCGFLRHRLGTPSITITGRAAPGKLTYKVLGTIDDVSSWWWHYPDGKQKCSK